MESTLLMISNHPVPWVYEEEFNCRDGFRWSPDGQYIAYWQSDTQGTGWFDIINNVDSIYPKIQRFPYPKAGTANSAVKVGYVSADGGNTTWLALPGDARNHYIPRMEFIPGCNELFIQQMNRAQNTNKVWIAKIGENTPVNIFTDQDAEKTCPVEIALGEVVGRGDKVHKTFIHIRTYFLNIIKSSLVEREQVFHLGKRT